MYLLPTHILHIYHAKLVQLVQKQNHAKNNGKQNFKKKNIINKYNSYPTYCHLLVYHHLEMLYRGLVVLTATGSSNTSRQLCVGTKKNRNKLY